MFQTINQICVAVIIVFANTKHIMKFASIDYHHLNGCILRWLASPLSMLCSDYSCGYGFNMHKPAVTAIYRMYNLISN